MQKISTLNAEKVNKHIVNWLKEYAIKAGVKGFVVGISGGIDSALTSTLCAQTGLTTLCVEMPIHQAESHVNRAYEHINMLKQKFSNVLETQINMTPIFESFKNEVPISENEDKLHLAFANTRSRLRMVSLYYLAGLNNLLVAGTGNKVEDFGVGFFTKYGDGGVDISPIADLLKSDVRTLASYVGVPESILNAKPTDGLFGDDRSDEDQLGANYDELEWAMKQLENGKNSNDFEGREKEVFKIYLRLNTINQHKMNPIPVCIIPNELK
ncbi:NAD(+) synthase [Flavobacterium columnare]|uniref:NH(3)-dependent NAD(+) synthetase n=1 Tax=Flavobacterium columnare TaxID=996 RepID=A0A437UCS6_9FLAO|nr:NAD(+) synthase [Flavobacterium columnare]RVU91423.1 NAD(+) synthase [Flavobacterium columnare]